MKSSISTDQILKRYHIHKAQDPRNFCLLLNFLLLFREIPRQLKEFEPVAFSEVMMIVISTLLLLPSFINEKYFNFVRFGFMLTQIRVVAHHFDFDRSRQRRSAQINSIINQFFLLFSIVGIFFHFYSFDHRQRGHTTFGVLFGNLIIFGIYADAFDILDVMGQYWVRIGVIFFLFQLLIFGMTRSSVLRRLYTDSMIENLQNQQFLKVLLDTQNSGIIIVDNKGKVTYSNPAFDHITKDCLDHGSETGTRVPSFKNQNRPGTFFETTSDRQEDAPPPKRNWIGAFKARITRCFRRENREETDLLKGLSVVDSVSSAKTANFHKLETKKIFQVVAKQQGHYAHIGEPMNLEQLKSAEERDPAQIYLVSDDPGKCSSFIDKGQSLYVRVAFTSLEFRDETRAMIEITDASKEVLYDKSKEMNELLTLMNATISHELRNPLNSIMAENSTMRPIISSLLEEVHKDLSLEKKIGATVSSLQKSHSQLATSSVLMNYLIHDFLDHAAIRQGSFKPSIEHLDLFKTIEEIASMFRASAQQKSIIFRTDLTAITRTVNSPQIVTDEKRLKQVLLNLVSNAFKFTEKGEITILARVVEKEDRFSLDNPLRHLEISVADTGVGIPYADQDKLFKLFGLVQNTQQDNRSGIGLGLVISEQIVKQFGGAISFTSVPYPDEGHGSIFTFSMRLEESGCQGNDDEAGLNECRLVYKWRPDDPIDHEVASCNVSQLSNTDHLQATDLRPKMRSPGSFIIHQQVPSTTLRSQPSEEKAVLIVDDQQFNIEALSSVLQNVYKIPGSTIDFAHNGRDAVLKVITDFEDNGSPSYQLILMDCNMPFMDGYEATKKIRQFYLENGLAQEDQPIISAVTAHTEPQYVKKCFDSGMNQVISKPVQMAPLKFVVEASGMGLP